MTSAVSEEELEAVAAAQTEVSDEGVGRDKLTLYTAPALPRPPQPDELSDEEVAELVTYFDYSGLVDEEHGDEEVRGKVADMVRAISPGNIVTNLFDQGPDGMSLIHAWFGPHFPLFRHSHPQLGDCLYYIVGGSAILGSRVLGPGDGFFVPNGAPYKYRAGPQGVEILEFRAGGGDPDAPILKLHEPAATSLDRIAEAATELRQQWDPPTRIGDTPRPA
jgi:hypothetical protein